MPRLIIHLGTHKTGSSSFQQFMVEQADWLRAHGVEPYVETRGDALRGANAVTVAHDLLRAEAVTGPRFNRKVPAPTWQRRCGTIRHIRRTMAAAAARDLLISAEAFDFFRTPQEARVVRLLAGPGPGVAIVPVMAMREDAAWRRSWHAQIARNPDISAADMAAPDFPLLAPWWFDRAAIRAFWHGIGPLAEVDYDAAVAKDGNVIPALVAAMGLPRPPITGIWANRTPVMA